MERTVVISDVDTNRSLKTGITTQRIAGVPKGTMRVWCMGLPRLVSAYQQVVQVYTLATARSTEPDPSTKLQGTAKFKTYL